ncbi:MAG: hypothetical protein LBJ17_04580 [Dysgonamonadaceae bacterium]|jgi:hypothetical protein|nr:hypothetical protein [Dysgonamonadaceae bacterium]
MNDRLILLYVICLLLSVSCSNKSFDAVPTFTVTHTNFVNYIDIDGYTEPLSVSSACAPEYFDGEIEYIIEDGTFVNEGDIVCRVKSPELQTTYDESSNNLQQVEAQLNTQRASLEMQEAVLKAEIMTNEAQDKITALDSLQISYLSPKEARIKQLELEQSAINKSRFEKKIKALEVIRQSELKKMELQVQQYRRQLDDIAERREKMNIKALRRGLAMRAVNPSTGQQFKVGEPCWSEMPIVNIPDVSGMKVKISAPEADFKAINKDDTVIYSFDAMPNITGQGRITLKSTVGNNRNSGIVVFGGGVIHYSNGKKKSKVKFFDIEASIDTVQQMPEPGFSTRCHILLKQVKDTLVVPQISVFEEDSMKVVFVKQYNGFEKREIATGLSSQKEIIVSAGLKEGEIITLVRPKNAMINNTVLLPVL